MKTSDKEEETSSGTPKVKGKKFSEAVTQDKPMLWDQGLEFDGSTMPIVFQKTLLKDWLLSDQSFEEICRMHGLTDEETLSLKTKLPQNIIALKEMQVTRDFPLAGRSTGDEASRQAILVMISDGLRLSRMVRVKAEVKFMDGQMTTLELGHLVNSWHKILQGVGTFLSSEELNEEESFRTLMQMTREELRDLKSKIEEYRHYQLDVPEAEIVLEDDEENVTNGESRGIRSEE